MQYIISQVQKRSYRNYLSWRNLCVLTTNFAPYSDRFENFNSACWRILDDATRLTSRISAAEKTLKTVRTWRKFRKTNSTQFSQVHFATLLHAHTWIEQHDERNDSRRDPTAIIFYHQNRTRFGGLMFDLLGRGHESCQLSHARNTEYQRTYIKNWTNGLELNFREENG